MRNEHGKDRWRDARVGVHAGHSFWYRSDPETEIPWRIFDVGRITETIRPVLDDGNALIRLGSGRASPQPADRPGFYDTLQAHGPLDWHPFLAAAGLDTTRFARCRRRSSPYLRRGTPCWRGTLAGNPPTRSRWQAASLRGRPVQFRILRAWETAAGGQSIEQPTTVKTINKVLSAILIV